MSAPATSLGIVWRKTTNPAIVSLPRLYLTHLYKIIIQCFCSFSVAQTCPKLDSDPGNGRLLCTQTLEYNAVICHIKCDPGFFFVSGINNYVTCGPDSYYKWSHRLVNATARIPTCTRKLTKKAAVCGLLYNLTFTSESASMQFRTRYLFTATYNLI